VNFVAHVIAPRETLASISRLYHTRTADIAAVNRINPDARINTGEILVVPVVR
jgi:LysM repeat protein